MENDEAYFCCECGGVFGRPCLGHCPKCDHHYEAGTECSNCHDATIPATMKKIGLTGIEFCKAIDFAKDEHHRFLRMNPRYIRKEVMELMARTGSGN